jgi:NTE family protein
LKPGNFETSPLCNLETWKLETLRLRLFATSQRLLLLAVVVLTSLPGFAQQAGPPPKIGLVLEGGGALGLAHVGVLQWLEEHRIPVSYVAGTSMGGLVGGLYAVGNSPADIRKLIEGIDWNDVLKGQIPYQDLEYRRKEDARDYPNGLEFGIRQGIRFPEGFNSGYQVGLILDRIALPYSDMKSFDDLPIPFRCVATDLVSSRARVFREGSLSLALRSTMSLPGIFTPVRAKDAIYTDGGMLDNLPVDVAADMGAGLVLAVHLETRPLKPTEPLSSVGVLGRSMSVVVAANELKSMEKADILISVPLGDFTSSDYEKAQEIIRKGYDAAASKAAILSVLSVDEETWRQYLARREARRRVAPVPQFLEVTGTKPVLAKAMERELAPDVGKPVNSDELDAQLTRLMGYGRFSRLGYRMAEENGRPGLEIRADEKEYDPPEVRPLIVIDGAEYNNIQFLLGARLTFLDLGGFGSEWRSDVTLGSEYGINSEFYRPWGTGLHWFVAPRLFADNTLLEIYDGGTLEAEYREREAGGAFDAGYRFNRDNELRFGYESAYEKFYPSIGSLLIEELHGRSGITSVRYNYLGQDDPIIPRKGLEAHFSGQWDDANPGAAYGFPAAQAHVSLYQPLNRPASVFFSAFAGSTFGYHDVGVPPFSLGGNAKLVAYGENEFLTDQYLLFKAGFLRKLVALPPLLGGNVYALGYSEVGKVFDIPNVSPVPADLAGSLVVNTIFGPVFVGAAYGATGHHKIFFGVGRVF